jgi:hypothetical protein
LLAVSSFIICVLQMVLIHWANSGQIRSWAFFGVSLFSMVVQTACWILVLVAIFRGRPPDAGQSERAGGDPLPASQPDAFDAPPRNGNTAELRDHGLWP